MPTSRRDRWQVLLTPLIEVAYPRRCAGCGLRGRWLCDDCLESVPLFAEPRCPICSIPLHAATCDCRELPTGVDRMWVAGPYDGWLRNAVYDFKFKGETARAPSLAALLVDACSSFGADTALVPVPMHKKRKRQRGYDQVAMLAYSRGKADWAAGRRCVVEGSGNAHPGRTVGIRAIAEPDRCLCRADRCLPSGSGDPDRRCGDYRIDPD